MRKCVLVLVLFVGLGTALFVWFAAEDARQAALFDARVRQAQDQATQARDRFVRLRKDKKASGEEVGQAAREWEAAEDELAPLRRQGKRREASWPARLRAEVRRRTGW